MKTFKELSLNPTILTCLENMGFTNPTEIQEKAIPLLLQDEKVDLFGQAQTGTGKTYAFGLPLLQKINPEQRHVQGIIVAPTRELVVQITEALQKITRSLGVSIESVYGGVSIENQIRGLKRGAHIVVGTPGRLNDHLKRKTLNLQNITTLVLDEADIMLDMGFKDDVDKILSYSNTDRNIWLFSATLKAGISQIMKTYMKKPVTVHIAKKVEKTENIQQFYCLAPARQRLEALCRFIDVNPSFNGFIFCRTKALTGELAEELSRFGYPARALHGDMKQNQRNIVIKDFKRKAFPILVATDVAARGIDIDSLTHVINYSFPEDYESYIHRIGRTGRAGKEGTAITFINPSEQRHIGRLERMYKTTINRIDAPSAADIAQIHMQKVQDFVQTMPERKADSPYHKQLQELIATLDPATAATTAVQLLHEKFFKNLKNTEITSSAPRERSRNESDDRGGRRADRRDGRRGERRDGRRGDRRENSFDDGATGQELKLFIGSDRGVTKKDLLTFIVKNTNIKPATITKIKVTNSLSFVKVPHEDVSGVVKNIQGKMLNGNKIRLNVL